MIFATVGTQLPFDRLVVTLDCWAKQHPEIEVFAQTGTSGYTPESMQWSRHLKPAEFEQRLNQASVIVSHAGIGSIISALQIGKPIIIMPRQAQFGEHRNDHQLATAQRFQNMQLVRVAVDEADLHQQLNAIDPKQAEERFNLQASPQLLARLRKFIASESWNVR